MGFFSCHAGIDGMYKVNSDTLSDYGTIEISFDTGNSWVNLIDSSNYSDKIYWLSDVPTLTGNSNGWQSFYVQLVHFEHRKSLLRPMTKK